VDDPDLVFLLHVVHDRGEGQPLGPMDRADHLDLAVVDALFLGDESQV